MSEVEPLDLVHRSTPAKGLCFDGSDGSRRDILRWVIGAGGQATDHLDGLLVMTPTKWAPVLPGWWVIQGVVGQFFVIEPEVYAGSYDRVIVDFGANLGLSDDQLRGLRVEAGGCSDPERLREIVGLVVAAALDRG